MKHYGKDESNLIVLEKGEELFETLTKFFESNVGSFWLSGLGGALEAELGFYNLDSKQYEWKTFTKTLEVTSLTGNIVRDENNKPLFHVHGNFADQNHTVFGGHVNKLVTGGTLELNLTPIKDNLTRELKEEIGLKLLKEN